MSLGDLVPNYALRKAIQEWQAEQPLAIEPGRVRVSEPEEVIGRGSFGKVVAGLLVTHGRELAVALKMLPEMTATEEREQFDRELKAHLTAQQGAEGVCRLLGTSEVARQPCLVMKRYQSNLAARLRDGALDRTEVRRVTHELARTLEQLHGAGVIVRDIKPDNILFDSYARPHIADFGISTVLSRATRYVPTTIKGAFNYMAPESFEEEGIGFEVDIWALGCVVLEMSTATMPWAGRQMQQIWKAVCVDRRIPDVPDHVPEAAIVRRCFEFEPARRPTAGELRAAFAPERAELPEIVGGMAETFARKIEQLTADKAGVAAERDQARAERDQVRAERDQARAALQAERTRAEAIATERHQERARAEAMSIERNQANAERDQERARAEAERAEAARLRAQLASMEGGRGPPPAAAQSRTRTVQYPLSGGCTLRVLTPNAAAGGSATGRRGCSGGASETGGTASNGTRGGVSSGGLRIRRL